MSPVRGLPNKAWFQKWNHTLHRDIGYFLSAFLFIYSLSGIALNHVHEWNPDFVLIKKEIRLNRVFADREVTPALVAQWDRELGEPRHNLVDTPTPGVVKVYYDHGTLLVRLADLRGDYERLTRRPLFYDANALHRNSLKGWRWFSDIFSVLLMVLTGTGILMLSGKKGFAGRGKWFVLAGAGVPLGAAAVFRIF